ncbi:sugar ABC transporter permease, partial [Blautia faecis]|nr:sugar ABC transporter permease [Blautia faecis]
MGTNKRNRFDVSPYLFISPVFILLALLVVYPIAYAFYLSVMDTNLTTKWELNKIAARWPAKAMAQFFF